MIKKAKEKRQKGVKFVEKYKVSTANIYKGDGEALKIPPPGHVLYDATAPTVFDELRVAVIDRDGKMTDPIEVWTDPDSGTLWVLDGRARLLDVREVNRRRKSRGCSPVEPYIVPFSGDEARAIARLREKNYHRRVPTLSAMAQDLLALRNAGYGWDKCAEILHHKTDDPEQWGRKILPIAFCIHDVQQAIDDGTISRSCARRLGGSKPDGLDRMGDKLQAAELAVMLEGKSERRPTGPVKGSLGAKARIRVRESLLNGAIDRADVESCRIAKIVAATIARKASGRR